MAAAGAAIVMHALPGLIVTAGLCGGLMFSLYGISVAHTNDLLQPAQVLDATRGLLLIYGLGAFCGPVLGGIAMQVAGPVGLPIASTATTARLAVYGVYRITQRPPPPVEAQTEFVALVRTTRVVLGRYREANPEPGLNLSGPDASDDDGRDGVNPSDRP